MEFKNRTSGFIWAFTCAWLTLLLSFTFVLAKDGPPDQFSFPATLIFLILFWMGGLALGVFAMKKPCFSASINGSELALIWRYPFKRVRATLPLESISPPEVVDSSDSEGDPYFFARLILPDSKSFDLAEGHHRAHCEDVCEAFRLELKKLKG